MKITLHSYILTLDRIINVNYISWDHPQHCWKCLYIVRLQYCGHLMQRVNSLGQEERGVTKDEMVGWHHLIQWTWVWAHSRRQWRTGKPGVLWSMGSQRIGHDSVTIQQPQARHVTFYYTKLQASAFCWFIQQLFTNDLMLSKRS